MAHPFELYYRKHSHYPRVRRPNGASEITVTLHAGYLHIKQSAPFSGEVYIVRSTWIELIRALIPLTRRWTHHEDFDVPAAVHRDYLEEIALRKDLRATKGQRRHLKRLGR